MGKYTVGEEVFASRDVRGTVVGCAGSSYTVETNTGYVFVYGEEQLASTPELAHLAHIRKKLEDLHQHLTSVLGGEVKLDRLIHNTAFARNGIQGAIQELDKLAIDLVHTAEVSAVPG